MEPRRLSPIARVIAAWGTLGVMAIIGYAIVRVGRVALLAAAMGGWSAPQIAFLAAWVPAMAYLEGYRGFQRAFAPRVVVRALWLGQHPRAGLVLLAPLFCMGLIHATRRRMTSAWALLATMVILVLAVGRMDLAWRGLVDIGVVLGLVHGEIAMGVFLARGLAGRPPSIPHDVPED